MMNFTVETVTVYNVTESHFNSKLGNIQDYGLGIGILIISIASILLNSLVIVVMCQKEKKLTAPEYFIFHLSVTGLLQSLLGYPLNVVALFIHHWPLEHIGCIFNGFIVFFLSMSSIAQLMALAIWRYSQFRCPTKRASGIAGNKVKLSIIGAYVYASIWCVPPLMGWGSYGLEPFGSICSLAWDRLPLSYIISIFIGCYILPLGLLGYTYTYMALKGQGLTKLTSHSSTSLSNFYMTKVACVVTILFGATWTPYAIFTFYTYLRGSEEIPRFTLVIPSLVAKTSTMCNPLVYFLMVRRFRKAACKLLGQLFLRPDEKVDVLITLAPMSVKGSTEV